VVSCGAQPRPANPNLLLATNFGMPERIFAEMPKGAVIMPN